MNFADKIINERDSLINQKNEIIKIINQDNLIAEMKK